MCQLNAIMCKVQSLSSPTKATNKNLANVLITFLKFAYWFGFTPFKVVKDEFGVYHLYSWLPQQVHMKSLHILVFLIDMITVLRDITLFHRHFASWRQFARFCNESVSSVQPGVRIHGIHLHSFAYFTA